MIKYHNIYKYFLIILSGTGIVFSLSAASIQSECDSIFLRNGKAYAVKNIVLAKEEMTFVFCDDQNNNINTAPWMQINYIKKADGTIIDSPLKKQVDDLLMPPQKEQSPPPKKEKVTIVLTPEEAAKELESRVNNLKSFAIVSWFAGPLVGAAVLVLVFNYRKKIKGHPNEKQLRKKLKKIFGITMAGIIMGPVLAFLILVLMFHLFFVI